MEDKNETFKDWSKKHREQPKFPYWGCVLELELSILQFTQSIPTAYFNQFIQTLTKLLPCCCCCFPLTTSTTPDGYQCTFVTCVNSEAPIRVSSLLQWWICCAQAHDQAHEQFNAMVRGNGSAVGLASNLGALRWWVTTGPHIARLLKSFEHGMTSKVQTAWISMSKAMHRKKPSSEINVQALVSFEEAGNPFEDSGLQRHCRRGYHDCS